MRLFILTGSLVLFTASLPVRAQDSASATHFLQSIYRHYDHHGSGVDYAGPNARNYFDASMVALLRADEKVIGPNDAVVLDCDPFCGCQDWDGIWNLDIRVQPTTNGHTRAAVSFSLFATNSDRRSLEYALVAVSGQWRIDNIVDKSDPKAPFDLRASLNKEIRDARPDPKNEAPRRP